MIEFDINNPFNEASKDGMLPDGCGIFERYNTMGAEVDFCGLSPNPADYDTPQTLYTKVLELAKRIIIAVDLNTNGSYKPSDFENFPLISDATSVKDAIEILSDFIEKLQKDKFDKLNLKLKYDNGIVSLMFNDIAYTSINIPEEQFLDDKETKFITSATQEDVDKDPSVIIGNPYLRLAFKTIDSEGTPTITYSYIPMNYMSNVYTAEATDSIGIIIKTSGNTGAISANLTIDNDPTNAIRVNTNGVYVENLTDAITNETNRATINEARIETLVDTKFNDITDEIVKAKQEAISTSASDATAKANTAKQEAIAVSEIDATTKANAAKTEAISAAALDATTKANTAKQEAITDATDKITIVKNETIIAAASDATEKANKALEDAKLDTISKIDAVKVEIITSASLDATAKANSAKQEAIAASSVDATTKANIAKQEAISAAALDATTKANTAKQEAISAAALDATTKINQTKQEVSLAILDEKNRAVGVEGELKIEIDTKVSTVILSENTDKSMQYILYVDGVNKGEINIPVNQFLKSAIYDATTKQLVFTFRTENGEVTTPIDMTDLVDTYTAGDGLTEVNNKFSIVIDPTSESYFTVSSNGVKINGIREAIKTVNDNLTNNLGITNTNLTNEIDRAKVAEKVISDSLDSYKTDNKTYIDSELSTINSNLTNSINNVNGNLGNRITAVDTALRTDLVNSNNSLTSKINKVETDLNSKIDLIETGLTTEINTIETNLNSEVIRAKTAEKLNSDNLSSYKTENKTYIDAELIKKQTVLISGTNIKTINGDSVLGSGNIIISATNTVGDLKMSVLSNTHDGWVLCNGAAISRATYAVLFSVIGTSFGAGDNSTTFNVPNMIGQVAAGANGNLGERVGATGHNIGVTNLPNYNMTVNNNAQQTYSTDSNGNHTHSQTNDGLRRTSTTATDWYSSKMAIPICRNVRSENGDGRYDNMYLYNDGGGIDNQSDVDWLQWELLSNITIANNGSHTHTITPPVHSHIVNSGGGGNSISNYQPTTFLGNYFIYSGVK